jgi:hypothetical protein
MPRLTPKLVLILGVLIGLTSSLVAKRSEWQDLQGTVIKGEPVEILGPFALFRDGATQGKRMLLRGMSEEDCRRFYRETISNGARADRFSDATGLVTRGLRGSLMRVVGEELVEADLTQIPEPEILIVLYASHNDGESWRMLENFVSAYHRLKRVYQGRIECLYFGIRQDAVAHRRIATRMHMPWLVTDPLEQRKMSILEKFEPRDGPSMLVISRHGAPLLSGSGENLETTMKFADALGDLVGLMNPANPRTWKDRAHYFGAIRADQFAQSDASPEMVGNPLRADAMRDYGVQRIDARLAVGRDGKVESVDVLPTSIVPEKLLGPLQTALQRSAIFLPAMKHGQAAAGTYDYHLAVSPEDRVAEADAAWLSGDPVTEVVLNSWLVLRPILVPESDFSDVAFEMEDGILMMKAVEVADTKFTKTEQLSAFSSNWFDFAGAKTVNPKVGDEVTIMGKSLRWESVTGDNGLIDFQKGQSPLDYSIGYAWIDFEVPKAMQAWLGIGSDDGLKIWHNGEPVHENWIRRISRIDDDIVPIKLTAGRNQLLIKIQNVRGEWSFISRLRIKPR